ncbi:hypothetical protein [Aequorivita antarctica]|uniref:Uncharacterized protein n=1 Tax=Aequorivita antarctica TaxID=153266 RepID=A0A5C6YYB2_9FLAO|nr:hypothetical protein [Aequorivita antarctica]TXD72724.1 hypothetical protein ESU54_10910 [Aequorivita antarctica]SRX74752.1 hypothetical protein AEQU3_01732 [Aequorivita antarctica]
MNDKEKIPFQDTELDEDLSFELPESTRLIITIPAILVSLLIIGIYVYLIFCDPEYIDPEKFGFPAILIALVLTIIIINLPWNKLGFRIKKIGMIELENVVKGQAQNNSKELADLQKQIDGLRSKLSANPIGLIEDNSPDELVIKFLEQYNQWAFSALRIRKWGARQSGFENLSNYQTEEIRESLRRLLSKKKVETRVSKKGNTLYIAK